MELLLCQAQTQFHIELMRVVLVFHDGSEADGREKVLLFEVTNLLR